VARRVRACASGADTARCCAAQTHLLADGTNQREPGMPTPGMSPAERLQAERARRVCDMCVLLCAERSLACSHVAASHAHAPHRRLPHLPGLRGYHPIWSLNKEMRRAGVCCFLRPGLVLVSRRFSLDPRDPPMAHHPEGRVILLEFRTVRVLFTYVPNNGKDGACVRGCMRCSLAR
jgi:hypothetical protein